MREKLRSERQAREKDYSGNKERSNTKEGGVEREQIGKEK